MANKNELLKKLQALVDEWKNNRDSLSGSGVLMELIELQDEIEEALPNLDFYTEINEAGFVSSDEVDDYLLPENIDSLSRVIHFTKGIEWMGEDYYFLNAYGNLENITAGDVVDLIELFIEDLGEVEGDLEESKRPARESKNLSDERIEELFKTFYDEYVEQGYKGSLGDYKRAVRNVKLYFRENNPELFEKEHLERVYHLGDLLDILYEWLDEEEAFKDVIKGYDIEDVSLTESKRPVREIRSKK